MRFPFEIGKIKINYPNFYKYIFFKFKLLLQNIFIYRFGGKFKKFLAVADRC